jgi:hypothetical protein
MKLRCTLPLLAALALLAGLRLSAQEEKKEDLGEPGPEHKLLAKLAGDWDAKVRTWSDPEKPPSETPGTLKRKMILAGRYLQEDFVGKAGPDDLTGLSLIAFDRARKKFVSTWFDSLSTGVIYTEGTYDDDKKTITYLSAALDSAGKKIQNRDVLRLISDDEQIVEMHRTPEGGKEIKLLEIIYTRRKSAP